eukprot:3165149-Prymnesium_polylepis.1
MSCADNTLRQWLASTDLYEADISTVLGVLAVERVTTVSELEREVSDPEMLEVLLGELRTHLLSKTSLRRVERAMGALAAQYHAESPSQTSLPAPAMPLRSPLPASPSQAHDGAEITPPPPPSKPQCSTRAGGARKSLDVGAVPPTPDATAMISAAVRLQAAARRSLARRRLDRAAIAAIHIHACWRRSDARDWLYTQKRNRDAAVNVQSAFRSHRARRFSWRTVLHMWRMRSSGGGWPTRQPCGASTSRPSAPGHASPGGYARLADTQ